jgi:hypothetical protein
MAAALRVEVKGGGSGVTSGFRRLGEGVVRLMAGGDEVVWRGGWRCNGRKLAEQRKKGVAR